jgi:hypothetical protein
MIADTAFTNQQMMVTWWKLRQLEVICIDEAAQQWKAFHFCCSDHSYHHDIKSRFLW